MSIENSGHHSYNISQQKKNHVRDDGMSKRAYNLPTAFENSFHIPLGHIFVLLLSHAATFC